MHLFVRMKKANCTTQVKFVARATFKSQVIVELLNQKLVFFYLKKK